MGINVKAFGQEHDPGHICIYLPTGSFSNILGCIYSRVISWQILLAAGTRAYCPHMLVKDSVPCRPALDSNLGQTTTDQVRTVSSTLAQLGMTIITTLIAAIDQHRSKLTAYNQTWTRILPWSVGSSSSSSWLEGRPRSHSTHCTPGLETQLAVRTSVDHYWVRFIGYDPVSLSL